MQTFCISDGWRLTSASDRFTRRQKNKKTEKDSKAEFKNADLQCTSCVKPHFQIHSIDKRLGGRKKPYNFKWIKQNIKSKVLADLEK